MEPHHAGDVVADTYRIEGVLGQGGIGTTYAAVDVRTGQRVALKQVWLWQRHDWKVYELFEREARVLAGISHPAVPRYLGHFQLETERGPCFYLAQELAPGYPLASWAERGWRPDEAEIRRIADELLQILEHLHALAPPVIHRDIKPENVLRSEDGRLFLVDFGSVRDTYQNTIAHGSTIAGTFGYMAPEQFRGHAVPATDLYGLGALLVFLLTAVPPSRLSQKKGRPDFRTVTKVSFGFAAWLDRLLEPEPTKRFASAQQARLELGRCDAVRRRSALRFALHILLISVVVVPLTGWLTRSYLMPGPSRERGYTPWTGPRTTSGKVRYKTSLTGHWSAVYDVLFVGEDRIISTSNDATVKLWELESGKVLRSFAGHQGRVSSAAITSDGRTLVTGGNDGVRIWSVPDAKLVRAIPCAQTFGVAISPDDKVFASGQSDRRMVVRSIQDGSEVRSLSHGAAVFAVAFTPDGTRLVSGASDGSVDVWRTSDGQKTPLGNHGDNPVNEIAVAPDGETIASVGDDHLVKVWILQKNKLLRTLDGHDDEVWAAAFAPDGKQLATGGRDGKVRIWDIYSGEGVEHITSSPQGVLGVRFSPSGKRLAIGTGANWVQVWETFEPTWRPPVVDKPVVEAKPRPPENAPKEEQLVLQAEWLLDHTYRRGYFVTARERLDEALEINPKYADTHATLANLELKEGNIRGNQFKPESLKRAHEHLDRALELDPKSVRAHVRRAYAHSYQDDLDKAEQSASKAYDLAPTNPRVLLLQARLAARRKNDDEVLRKLRALYDRTEGHHLRSAVYDELVDLYRRRGEWDAADETYRSLVNLEPDSPWTRGNYAAYLIWRERWDEAIKVAKEALAISDYAVGRYTLASAYAGKALAQKDPKEAEKLVDEAFKAHRLSADAHYARGVLAMRENSNLRARLAFKQALAIEPKHAEAKKALEDLDR